jgi:AdoMet-dependent rRNA methyltransferase SPB1
MTAPLDIGMEQQDAMLGVGQDDMFDLGRTEEDLNNDRGSTVLLLDSDGDAVIGSSDEDDEEAEDEEPLDSEEEREHKISGLEAELDGLYNAYQGRLRERDANFKVKEARRKAAEREEWNGIKAKDSDEEDSDEEEGGWDRFQKAKFNDQNSSEDSSDEFEVEEAPRHKRARSEKTDSLSKKRPRLVSKLEPPKSNATTRAARVWFAQDVFFGLGGPDKHADFEFEGEDGEESKHTEEQVSF